MLNWENALHIERSDYRTGHSNILTCGIVQPKLHQCYFWPVSFAAPCLDSVFATQESGCLFQILDKLRGRILAILPPSINFSFCISPEDTNSRTGDHYRKHPGFFAIGLGAFRSKVRYSSILQAKHEYPVELLAFSGMTREAVNAFMRCDSLVTSFYGDVLFEFVRF